MKFTYWECPDCGFDAVVADEGAPPGTPLCPLCAGDNGRDVSMVGRPATDEDRPEGRDARKEQ